MEKKEEDAPAAAKRSKPMASWVEDGSTSYAQLYLRQTVSLRCTQDQKVVKTSWPELCQSSSFWCERLADERKRPDFREFEPYPEELPVDASSGLVELLLHFISLKERRKQAEIMIPVEHAEALYVLACRWSVKRVCQLAANTLPVNDFKGMIHAWELAHRLPTPYLNCRWQIRALLSVDECLDQAPAAMRNSQLPFAKALAGVVEFLQVAKKEGWKRVVEMHAKCDAPHHSRRVTMVAFVKQHQNEVVCGDLTLLQFLHYAPIQYSPGSKQPSLVAAASGLPCNPKAICRRCQPSAADAIDEIMPAIPEF